MNPRIVHRLCGLAGILLAMVLPAIAHYSLQGTFDTERMVALDGVITHLDWRNPMVYVHLSAQDAEGNTAPWVLRLSGARELMLRGFPRERFANGSRLAVQVWPAKPGAAGNLVDPSKGERLGAAWQVTFDDGLVLPEACRPSPPWPAEANLFESPR